MKYIIQSLMAALTAMLVTVGTAPAQTAEKPETAALSSPVQGVHADTPDTPERKKARKEARKEFANKFFHLRTIAEIDEAASTATKGKTWFLDKNENEERDYADTVLAAKLRAKDNLTLEQYDALLQARADRFGKFSDGMAKTFNRDVLFKMLGQAQGAEEFYAWFPKFEKRAALDDTILADWRLPAAARKAGLAPKELLPLQWAFLSREAYNPGLRSKLKEFSALLENTYGIDKANDFRQYINAWAAYAASLEKGYEGAAVEKPTLPLPELKPEDTAIPAALQPYALTNKQRLDNAWAQRMAPDIGEAAKQRLNGLIARSYRGYMPGKIDLVAPLRFFEAAADTSRPLDRETFEQSYYNRILD